MRWGQNPFYAGSLDTESHGPEGPAGMAWPTLCVHLSLSSGVFLGSFIASYGGKKIKTHTVSSHEGLCPLALLERQLCQLRAS